MAAAKDDKASAAFEKQLKALLEGREQMHPSEVFNGVADDFWLWLNTEGRETSTVVRDMLPGLPEPAVQRRWTGKDGYATMAEGFAIYRTMRDLHDRHFGQLRDHGPIVDFGCGFGRVIRYFLKDVAPGQLIGSDYNETLLDFCIATNPWCDFNHNDAGPPLAFADNSVGYIYAYSLFSHFDEPMAQSWLEEFKRVLRPGGALALTIRPRTFLEHYRRLQTGEAQGVAPVNENIFPDVATALAEYDEGKFCYTPYHPSTNPWWGEAVIPLHRAAVEQGVRHRGVRERGRVEAARRATPRVVGA